ncbi:hypothetical protein ACJX0J_009384, partial [Zea mays]
FTSCIRWFKLVLDFASLVAFVWIAIMQGFTIIRFQVIKFKPSFVIYLVVLSFERRDNLSISTGKMEVHGLKAVLHRKNLLQEGGLCLTIFWIWVFFCRYKFISSSISKFPLLLGLCHKNSKLLLNDNLLGIAHHILSKTPVSVQKYVFLGDMVFHMNMFSFFQSTF